MRILLYWHHESQISQSLVMEQTFIDDPTNIIVMVYELNVCGLA